MLREIKIENYKSILDDTISLGRINIFIGANGSGKTNILEALAMVSASKAYDLNVEGLYNRGVRVTKPSLTFSSFLGSKINNKISVNLKLALPRESKNYEGNRGSKNQGKKSVDSTSIVLEEDVDYVIRNAVSIFTTENKDDIYSIWKDEEVLKFEDRLSQLEEQLSAALDKALKAPVNSKDKMRMLDSIKKSLLKDRFLNTIYHFLIYTLNTQALRGISLESRKTPLGINGEGLDILLANFDKEELEQLSKFNFLVSWLDEWMIDEKDTLKFKGHKLGRSNSLLYFRDKFMRKNNNVFSAENANEGALHILFYLALFISKRTPSLFAIDNIETALNPRICRTLIKELAQLAKDNDKQALITTHNPAVLDGLNLHDDEQRLFVVYRNDEGHTKTERIKIKPDTKEPNLKLSEMWMRGYLGGLPDNF